MTKFSLLHILQLVKPLPHLKNEKRYAFSGGTAPYIYYRECPPSPGAKKRTTYDQPWLKKHELSKVAYTVSTRLLIGKWYYVRIEVWKSIITSKSTKYFCIPLTMKQATDHLQVVVDSWAAGSLVRTCQRRARRNGCFRRLVGIRHVHFHVFRAYFVTQILLYNRCRTNHSHTALRVTPKTRPRAR